MKGRALKVSPEDFIPAVLSPKERVEVAFRVTQEAFRGSTLTLADVEAAVRRVRRKS